MLGTIANAVSPLGSRSVAKAVAAHGHAHTERVPAGDVPSTVRGSDVWFDVVEVSATPRIVLGNDGHKYWVVRADGRAGRRGFIGLEHGLALPHIMVESQKFGTLSPKNVAAVTGQVVLDVAGSFDEDAGQSSDSGARAFQRRSTELDVPKPRVFKAHTVTEHVDRGQALLTPEARVLLSGLALSFDVEVRDGWIWAHSLFGDLVTDEDDVWEWALSETSRLVDLARLWGAGADFAREWAGYTEAHVERPRRIDGALSKRRWNK